MPRRDLVASIRLTASVGPAPARFRIWKAGPNPGDYGDLFFTPEAAARVMAEYERRGNALVMDYEHALNPTRNPTLDPADPPPTAGYLALELVATTEGPELWGVPRWSDCGRAAPVPDEVCCARHQIESGQRCYVSPDWQIDTDTREPVMLNRVSLVAEPATWGINLLASRAANGGNMGEVNGLRAAYAAAMGLKGSTNGKLAKAADTMCAELSGAAAALGINLEGADDASEEKPPPSERAEGQATTAAEPGQTPEEKQVDNIDDKGKTGGTVAGATASKVVGVSLAAVREEIVRHAEEQRLRTLVAARMAPEAANVVASMSLAQLRTAVRDLPAPKPADKGTGGDAGTNVTAGKGQTQPADEMSPEEAFRVKRWANGLGATGENLTAAKKAWEADPIGGEIEVDPFKVLVQAKRAKRPAATVEG